MLQTAMVLMISDNDDVSSHSSCGDLEAWKLKKSEKNQKNNKLKIKMHLYYFTILETNSFLNAWLYQ